MKEIINEVKRLFTEDELKVLIEEYIVCDGDFSKFYSQIYDAELGVENEAAELSLDIIPKCITKYILDNVIDFIEYCDNRQVRLINEIRKLFAKEVDYNIMKIDKLSESNAERKKYEREKYSYEKNINMWQIGYGIHIVLVRELISPLKKFMEENSQRAFSEIFENYRMVCKVHGILEQEIEDVQEKEVETEKTLIELENELQKLQKQEKRTAQQRDASKLLKNAYQSELDKKEEVG